MCLEGRWTSQLIGKLETQIVVDTKLSAMSTLLTSILNRSSDKGCLLNKI